MLEDLKNIQIEDSIVFNNEDITEFTGIEEMFVTGIKVYSQDDSEMIVIEMDEFYLVSHNFQSEDKYFIYQIIGEGKTEDLENEGYKFLNEDDDFRHKIIIRDEGKTYAFYHSETGAIYGLTRDRDDKNNQEPQEIAFCEFVSNSAKLNCILIEKEDNKAHIMQGFEIFEEDIVLEE